MEGLARGGVCTLLLGGLLAVRSDGLRALVLPLDTWPGLEPSSWSEFGPVIGMVDCGHMFVIHRQKKVTIIIFCFPISSLFHEYVDISNVIRP